MSNPFVEMDENEEERMEGLSDEIHASGADLVLLHGIFKTPTMIGISSMCS